MRGVGSPRVARPAARRAGGPVRPPAHRRAAEPQGLVLVGVVGPASRRPRARHGRGALLARRARQQRARIAAQRDVEPAPGAWGPTPRTRWWPIATGSACAARPTWRGSTRCWPPATCGAPSRWATGRCSPTSTTTGSWRRAIATPSGSARRWHASARRPTRRRRPSRWPAAGSRSTRSDESAARALMERLAAAGDRAGALAVYDRLAERLRTQLELAPSAVTRADRRGAARGAGGGRRPPPPRPRRRRRRRRAACRWSAATSSSARCCRRGRSRAGGSRS